MHAKLLVETTDPSEFEYIIEEKNNKVSVILLAGRGDSTNILYNYFKDKINFSSIIIEEKPSKKKLLKNYLRLH